MSWFDTLIDTAIRSLCDTSQLDAITDYIGGSSILRIVIINRPRDQAIFYKTPSIPARKWFRVSDALGAAGFSVEEDLATVELEEDAEEAQVEDLCKLAEQLAGGKGIMMELSEMPAYPNRSKA